MVAQPVVEKVSLPFHAVVSCDEMFPEIERSFHAWFTGKSNDGMQVVWHQQAKAAMPDEFLVVMAHGGQYRITNICPTEMVSSRWFTFDGDEERTALGNPLWDDVWQLFTDRQIHQAKLTKRAMKLKPHW